MNIYSILLISLIALVSPVASAQDMPALVGKPYPGAVPEHTKGGKHLTCGSKSEGNDYYCFLTRDPVEKVRAFYAKQGIRLEAPLATTDDLEDLLLVYLGDKPSALVVAPMEFYEIFEDGEGEGVERPHFNALVVEAGSNKAPLQADDKGRLAVSEDDVLGRCCALTSVSQTMVPLYGNIFMEPANLVPHYNRHLAMLGGFFREVDGNSVANMKYFEMHPTWAQPAAASGGNATDDKEEEMRKDLKEILARKPEKKREYQSLKRSVHNRESREKIQPELDKILMSDPELAAWKKRSDALEQQGSAKDSGQNNRALRDEDVEAYLQVLEKEVYYTRILIPQSGGRHLKSDAATVQREWKELTQ